jgi:hypothetical protein
MNATTAIATAVLLSFAGATAIAQEASPKAAAPKVAAAKPAKVAAAKPAAASSRDELRSQAKGMALAQETAEAVSANQLAIAQRVHTGKADCEFSQSVSVQPMADRPGHFKVGYKDASYTMVPEETTTGAVRLQDKRAGVMWLQIANKSMLMNSKIGQRMVDSCVHAEQRATVATAQGLLR